MSNQQTQYWDELSEYNQNLVVEAMFDACAENGKEYFFPNPQNESDTRTISLAASEEFVTCESEVTSQMPEVLLRGSVDEIAAFREDTNKKILDHLMESIITHLDDCNCAPANWTFEEFIGDETDNTDLAA